MSDDETLRDELKREVLAFLDLHPDAADSMEGIAHWWILHQRFLRGLHALADALEELERSGELERVQGPDGRALWRAGPARVKRPG
jgi:hypothetical protein